MKIHAATDWSIIREGKECAIFDRSTLEQVTSGDIHRFNEKYAFVFPEILLMECANAKNPKVVENIKRMERFLIISTRDEPIIPADLVPSPPHEIMKKDLGVSIFRRPQEDFNLVYFIPYDREARMDLMDWAKNSSAEEYYRYYDDFDQMFNMHPRKLKNDIVEEIRLRGCRRGYGDAPKVEIEKHIKEWCKRHGFNSFYGNQLRDVIGMAKMILERISIMDVIGDLSKIYRFESSWAKKRIDMRPNWPDPDDHAKYSYYFYFTTLCSAFCGFMMEKKYLRDWQYIYHLPFCRFITSDKKFFKNLRKAMKAIGTDRCLGINISDRIRIWGEDDI